MDSFPFAAGSGARSTRRGTQDPGLIVVGAPMPDGTVPATSHGRTIQMEAIMRDRHATTETAVNTNGRAHDLHLVRGFSTDAESVKRAVEGLAQASVPADTVKVFVVDQDGRRTRRVPVRDEPGALRGAIWGAILGGMVGLIVIVLAHLDVFGQVLLDPLGATSLLGAVRTIGAAAAMAAPFGALLGMGHWHGKAKLRNVDFNRNSVLVVVESDDLQDTARSVMEATGAQRVEG
jgi:hypothetical protein